MKHSYHHAIFFMRNQCKERAGCLELCVDVMSSPLPLVQKGIFVFWRPELVMLLTCDARKALL